MESSDPAKWQETLAILSTYGKSEEFPSLCLALGDRLNEFGDRESASLCFMCALNLERVAEYWRYQLENANKVRKVLNFFSNFETFIILNKDM